MYSGVVAADAFHLFMVTCSRSGREEAFPTRRAGYIVDQAIDALS